MSLTLGTNTWITLANAELYMATRLGASTFWHTAIAKEAALVTAYNMLVNCGLFEIPSEVSANMEQAQCEMALFLLQHGADMDARMGLQAQGVSQAGIVQETYGKEVEGIPLPPIVKQLLKEYLIDSDIQIIAIERDENEEVL